MSHGNVKRKSQRRPKKSKKQGTEEFELELHPGPPTRSTGGVRGWWSRLTTDGRTNVVLVLGVFIAGCIVSFFLAKRAESVSPAVPAPHADQPQSQGPKQEPLPDDKRNIPRSHGERPPVLRANGEGAVRIVPLPNGGDEGSTVIEALNNSDIAALFPGLEGVIPESQSRDLWADHMAPIYPSEAKAEGVSGRVLLLVFVGKEGKVDAVETRAGNPLLAEAAREAVKQWTFKPYLFDGKTPGPWKTVVSIDFRTHAVKALGNN
jgi:TonB family protein